VQHHLQRFVDDRSYAAYGLQCLSETIATVVFACLYLLCRTLKSFDFAYHNLGRSVLTREAASINSQLTGIGCTSMIGIGAGASRVGGLAV
jgi:hypothetical protein